MRLTWSILASDLQLWRRFREPKMMVAQQQKARQQGRGRDFGHE